MSGGAIFLLVVFGPLLAVAIYKAMSDKKKKSE